jgi:hypothetical protein
MHTVELLEQALGLARHLGYVIRQEWLGGMGGGGCELKGRKVFFFDLSLDAQEQLDLVVETLRHEPGLAKLDLSPELQALLESQKVA